MSVPRYREITISSIGLGVIIGVIMNASITYAGLKIGFTIGGSTIAAVLGFGVLRGLMKKGSILETNITQTVASAVNTPNSGVIFTVPVLFLLGYSLGFGTSTFWLITLACTVGAILGCAFIIPVRKQMLDIDRLRFPTGTAVAIILKSPGAGVKKSLVLVAGILLAASIFLPAGLHNVKFKASLDELDGLVKSGKISKKQAEVTRRINRWSEQGVQGKVKIPEEVAAKGRENKELLQARKIKLPEKSDELLEFTLAITAYEISQGEKSWDDLRRQYWAGKPLWGYSDLNWRLSPPPPLTSNDPQEIERHEQAVKNIDRNGDGQPDLLLTNDTIFVGRLFGFPSYLLFAFAIAPFSFGAGYITGRAGLLVLAGGILAYHILTPAHFLLGYIPSTLEAFEAPNYAHAAFNRPMGIGMLLGGALMGVLFALPAMKAAFKSIASAAKGGGGRDELGLKVLATAAGICFVLLLLASHFIGGQFQADDADMSGWLGGHSLMRSVLISVIGMAWIWFAGIIISQCAGMTDWSPISGMALLTVVFILLLAGTDNVLLAVIIGSTLCVAVTCASDMMQDLKTGYLVGAKPIRQQIVELATAGLGPIIAMSTILLLSETATFGSPSLPAPQAKALQAVIEGTQGGEMPYALYGAGALLAVGLGLGSFAGLGVLVGLSMYLPIEYILPYGVGCLANMLVTRVKGRTWAEAWGVPFCAGLIVGEAVLAIFLNAIALIVERMGL